MIRISDCIKKINAADIEKWKADITEVNIKGKDTEIGASFFSECDKLETITLPDAMTIIRDYLFLDCSSLKTIDLSNVTTIGRSAFDKCTSLKTIDLSNVTTIGRSAFNKCTSLEEIKIPKVAKIGCYAFDKCTSLKKIKIPASVKVINAGVFRGCTSLKEITFEGEIPKMGKNAIPEAFPKGIEKIKYKEASEEKIESIKKAIGNPKLKFEKI